MNRREFIMQLGWGLAAAWTGSRLTWPGRAAAQDPDLRLALLADAHLKDGDAGRPEAQALARAVAELRTLWPPPDLVLLAGDLAHRGRPDALDLGREILQDLPAPLWAVPGEGDLGPRGGTAWVKRFGPPQFCRPQGGAGIIGLDTVPGRTFRAPAFAVGPDQIQWLARELAELDPAAPLVILSHAPLACIYRPWGQWTGDAPEVIRLLSPFRQVLCLHGHVHGAWTGIDPRPAGPCEPVRHYSLPATAWPGPQAVQGTPAVHRPGLGPHGCGWALVTVGPSSANVNPHLWQA
jgi:3',5'-cyclic-AMP phosphodiesterase